jgi:arylsulfatase A-like enzyme
MQKKPHLLIMVADQWRGDVLGHMNNSAAITPNLDQFAQTEGVSFSQAFCQNPVCTPSRCSFMSGLECVESRQPSGYDVWSLKHNHA